MFGDPAPQDIDIDCVPTRESSGGSEQRSAYRIEGGIGGDVVWRRAGQAGQFGGGDVERVSEGHDQRAAVTGALTILDSRQVPRADPGELGDDAQRLTSGLADLSQSAAYRPRQRPSLAPISSPRGVRPRRRSRAVAPGRNLGNEVPLRGYWWPFRAR
jgi:hypothetical protein